MIKNTLYRFVSMRAPEVLEEKEVDFRFVRHPGFLDGQSSFLSGILDIADKSKKKFINDQAASFSPDAYKTREEVKSAMGQDFYDFAIWLSSNRAILTLEEVNEQRPATTSLSESLRLKLWDNLFYQIITFKSGYVREAIISVLVAEHFLKHMEKTEGTKGLRKLAQARVIIPKEHFGVIKLPSKWQALQGSLDKLEISTLHLDGDTKRAVAVTRINELEKVQKELKLAFSSYEKDNAAAYKQAQKLHSGEVADTYRKATPEVQSYADKETGLIRKIKSYPDLVLPEFSFEPLQELDDKHLKRKMSADTASFIAHLRENDIASTYAEAFEVVENSMQEYTYTVFSTAPSVDEYQQPTLSPGNSTNPGNYTPTIPITIPAQPVFNINSTGITSGPSSLLMVMDNMPSGIDITGGQYNVTNDDGSVISGNNDFTDNWVGNKLYVTLFVTNKINTLSSDNITLEGTLQLSNGGSIQFSGECHSIPHFSFTGSYREYKGNGVFTYIPVKPTDEDGDPIPDGDAVIDYTPSGFGVKRLGIADYRKLEQEVCCYVPGEVSNIENIMAREYKEKSTRRLRKSEDTLTTSKEQEKEKLTDTTTTDRFEMNREVSNLLAESTSIGANTSFTGKSLMGGKLSIGADFAHNTTKEQSDMQSVTEAREVTERALERVVQKVKEERIVKIIEEYEETNKHGYDNREGNQHISGVYRWVDKVYNNRIVNYGKRLIYEFMIPEPAAFHDFAITGKDLGIDKELPSKPVDPRVGDGFVKIATHKDIKPTNYDYWAGIYNAEVTPYPEKVKYIGKSFEDSADGHTPYKESVDIDIPEGYFTTSFTADYAFYNDGGSGYGWGLDIGNYHKDMSDDKPDKTGTSGNLNPYYNKIHVGCSSVNHRLSSATVSIKTELSKEAEEKWRLETFNAIISAYEERKAEYDAKMAELKGAIAQKATTNPLFYRQIENISLKKNCISYLANYTNMGLDMLYGRNDVDVRAAYEEERLEKYGTFVKFFEQAFEWDLMSYYFYPFYWAKHTKWKDLYNIDNDDALFRSFLQSGMARVVLTVRPGFEETVNWYMGTGQVWNGGQVPVLDDPMYLSVVEEMKELEGTVEETWESRVPTSLTVIQAGTIGLDVEGLPCNPECDDYKVFDDEGNLVNVISQKKYEIGKSYTPDGEEIPQEPDNYVFQS